ncbi:MAG: tRNA pseudouridine(38-40) synthase TruA [Vicinamibacterales bacterium]
MRTLKLTIAYDGTRFVGWQRQAEGTSIQGLLEEALARFEGAPVTVHGAGRTDAGVHALGQVASTVVACHHDVTTLLRALNAQLPEDVRLVRIEEVPPGFHARFSARSKSYRYVIRNAATGDPFDRGYTWHVPEPLDLAAMRQAARALIGTHDFAVFQSTGSSVGSTVRTIFRSELLVAPPANGLDLWDQPLSIRRGMTQGQAKQQVRDKDPTESAPPEARLIAYEVAGDGFLRHMVRAIVGTLMEIGRGRRQPEDIGKLLVGGVRSDAGVTAPSHGLCLVGVVYD